VFSGEPLILTAAPDPGRPAERGERGEVLRAAHISCTLPDVFAHVGRGEHVFLDDGKIGGVVERASPTELALRVTGVGDKGQRVREGKGINFPQTHLPISCLTEGDLARLPFVAECADVVEMSFVQDPMDVRSLRERLVELAAPEVGLVLKVETVQAFERLPELLFAGMEGPSLGVMIARGDLAVESGFGRLAEVQEEILWLSEAAHVPVVWATEVLDSMAKTGRMTRAEVTDAAMGARAECVMLNKGPCIVEAIATLDGILTRMQDHHDKKTSLLRPLHSWRQAVLDR
jgi:pyruvate kinase